MAKTYNNTDLYNKAVAKFGKTKADAALKQHGYINKPSVKPTSTNNIGLSTDKKTFTTPGGNLFDVKNSSTPKTNNATIPTPIHLNDTASTGVVRESQFPTNSKANNKDTSFYDLSDEEKKRLLKRKQEYDFLKSNNPSVAPDKELQQYGLLGKDTNSQKPDTVSLNASRGMATELLDGKIKGFTGSVFSDNTLKTYLKGQGYADNEIKGVIQARDSITQERQAQGQTKDVITQKTEAIQQEKDLNKKTILEQVQKTQTLAQRQAALRGIGISSMTSQEMQDYKSKGDDLINIYDTKKSLELQLFKAQQEKQSSKTINALHDSLAKSIHILNQGILDQTDLENKLIKQGKLESNIAFDNLVNSLSSTGVLDKSLIDVQASKLAKTLIDKYGNAIKVNGNTISIGGESSTNSNTVEALAQDLLSGGNPKIPSNLSAAVILRKNQLLQNITGEISLGDKMKYQSQARALANSIYSGKAKDSEVNSIFLDLVSGKNIGQVKDFYNNIGYSPLYTNRLKTTINTLLAGNFTGGDKKEIRDGFNTLLDIYGGFGNEAKDYLLESAIKKEKTASKDVITSRNRLIESMTGLKKEFLALSKSDLPQSSKDDIINKINDANQRAIQTGIWTNFQETVSQLFGKTSDPRVTKLSNKIALQIQMYRKAQSGAAFSESESREYASLFPTVGKNMDNNIAKIDGIVETFVKSGESFYNSAFGKTNTEQLFKDGVMGYKYGDIIPNVGEILGKSIPNHFQDKAELNESKDFFSNTSKGGDYTSNGKTFKLPGDNTGLTNPDTTGGTNKIQNDINRVTKGASQVNAKDIISIATNKGVRPEILAAFLRNDSGYGSKGLGSKNNNPGNIGQFDSLGTKGVKGYGTIQEGITATADNLQKRIKAYQSIYPNKIPTAFELAKGISTDGTKFFGPYMTDIDGATRVQDITNQLIG